MRGKIKNIIIFAVAAVVLVFLYVTFFSGGGNSGNSSLVTSSSPMDINSAISNLSNSSSGNSPTIGNDFLSLLLSIRSINLNDSIFSDKSWLNLRDSSVVLNPASGEEGRPNPFAPIGSDIMSNTGNPSSSTFSMLPGQMPSAGMNDTGSSGTNPNISFDNPSSSVDSGINPPAAPPVGSGN